MKELKELLQYLVKEGRIVLKAPVAFIILAVLIFGVVYCAATWRYEGIILNKDSDWTFRDRRVNGT